MSTNSDISAVAAARQWLDRDWALAVFMVRDLEVTEQAGHTEIAWAMHKHGCVRSEAVWLVSALEKYMQGGEREHHSGKA